MTVPLHGLNRTLCVALQGRDGCTCKHGTSCESIHAPVVQAIANSLQITTTDMANLATGRARVVLNPVRRARPEAMGKGHKVPRRPTLDKLDGD
jgi:hypothetical protein